MTAQIAPHVKIYFFHFSSFSSKLWAFAQMPLAPKTIASTDGLAFFKLMGSGGGDGFQWWPDFSVYSLLCIWENKEKEEAFLNSTLYKKYLLKASHSISFELSAFEAHGLWDGIMPFQKTEFNPELPIAVITRARIKLSKILLFWRYVPKVSHSLERYPDRFFGKGIGELPVIQQATFSVWKDLKSVQNYAYKNPLHKEVVKKTRELGWYSEEMFARFNVTYYQGFWPDFDYKNFDALFNKNE